jgi:hypothetical protein
MNATAGWMLAYSFEKKGCIPEAIEEYYLLAEIGDDRKACNREIDRLKEEKARREEKEDSEKMGSTNVIMNLRME